jgi:hypothetical protein
MYQDLGSRFPLSAPLLRLYSGPRPLARETEPFVPPSYLTDGTAELICLLAAEFE